MLGNLLLEFVLFVKWRTVVGLFTCNDVIVFIFWREHLIYAVISMNDLLSSGKVVGSLSFNIWVLVMDYVLNDVELDVFIFPVQFATLLNNFSILNRLSEGLSILSPFNLLNSPICLFFSNLFCINIPVNDIKYAVLIDIIVWNCVIICQDPSSIN